MRKKLLTNKALKLVCITGIVLALFISLGLVFFSFLWDSPLGRVEENFAFKLREYDHFNAPARVSSGDNPDYIESLLLNLQRLVSTVDEQMSVLKRYRALASIDRNYIPAYRAAAQQAAIAYPFSVPIAAVAADALVFDNAPLSEDAKALLRDYTSRVTQGNLGSLELSMHILAGNLDNPVSAAAIPWLSELLSMDFSALPYQNQRELLTADFLLRAHNRDINGASLRLNTLMADREAESSRRMAAEFLYDHGYPLRAAQLYLSLDGERDLARAADALAMAGEVSAARNIWMVLSRDPQTSERLRLQSYYNLASSSMNQAEGLVWIERVFSERVLADRAQGGQRNQDRIGIYSIIRYSRLLDGQRGIAILEGFGGNPALELELIRYNLDEWPRTRATSEIWQLLNRYPDDEELYEWAAWYFDYHRLFSETNMLIRNAQRQGMSGNWIALHRGIYMIREGHIAEGERILIEAADRPNASWQIYANLARIQEMRQDYSAALGLYQSAAAMTRERTQAAKLQLRISQCLNELGRSAESRRALELAFELDPDDINIRSAFGRLRN